MIVCNAVNHYGAEESMARLMAVEPLPVGERLARWFDRDPSVEDYTDREGPPLWMVMYESMNLDEDSDGVRAYARPLRHARERARAERTRMVLLNAAHQARYEDLRRIMNTHIAEKDLIRVALAALTERQFTIMDGPSIPWSLIAPHERQAQRNHGQSLETLNSRGGLSMAEAVAVLSDLSLREMRTWGNEDIRERFEQLRTPEVVRLRAALDAALRVLRDAGFDLTIDRVNAIAEGKKP